jgi:DNA-binding transcriptional LysR family regulator
MQAGVYQRRVFGDEFRCIVRAGHPAAAQRLTLPRYCELSHLLIAPRGTPGSFVDDELARHGRVRRVAVRVPHFLVAPHVIAASDLIATLASRIASAYAAPLGLTLLPPPIELPGFTVSMAWHERGHLDPGQRWLRAVVAEIAADA